MCKTVFTVVKSDDGVAARADIRNIYYYIAVLFFFIFLISPKTVRERRDIVYTWVRWLRRKNH